MSIYSTTTESNFNKPILNDELNYQKLQKFNKFYLTNSNFSCKTKTKIETSNKSEGLYNMNVPFSPKIHFYILILKIFVQGIIAIINL